ncbi:MAG: signal recognition particle protein [Alphaproteobacteria bacterium]|nr:signal recognition particle protein [Alphaproteobacteria bacterium]
MFESLTEKLGQVFDKLRGTKTLSEEDVDLALREIRVALLEADVALPVTKDFMARVKEAAVGVELIKTVSPAQQIVKIVNDAIVAMLGSGEESELKLDVTPPAVILMVGLQGSGKTTTTGKLAKHLTKLRKKVMMASLDTQRPAAQDQLRILGEQNSVDTLPIVAGQTPIEITKRALEAAKLQSYDVLILDTAGRLAIDDALMAEVAAVRDIAKPVETLLVVDAMMGQDAVNIANEFVSRVGITGTVLTRIDGDTRGGAAMSMRHVTGKPIKFLGVGEKSDALEAFKPDRIAGRILGMGDVVSLVEKAVETMDREKAAEAARKFQEGKFDLDDFRSQLQQMKSMGGVGSMMKMLPGLSRFSSQIDEAKLDQTVLKRQEAIMDSMTKKERAKPDLITNSGSRRRRIAEGSGTTVQEVNKLMKQFDQMQTMMKKMRKMGMGGLMGLAKGLMGGNAFDAMMADAAAQNPEEIEKLQKSMPQLGPNPFAGLGMGQAPKLPGGLPPEFFGKGKK